MRSPIRCLAAVTSALVTSAFVVTAHLGWAEQATAAGPIEYPDPASEEPLSPVVGRPLALDEAIALGLQNNLDLEVNRYQPYVSQLEADAAWGAYDPLFDAEGGYASSLPPTAATSLFSTGAYQTDGKARLSALLPYVGANIGVEFGGKKVDNPLFFKTLNPEITSNLGINASIPLLRGLIWNQPWTQVKLNHLAYGSSLDTFTTSIMDTVQSVISSYWQLVASKEQLRVAEKSLVSTSALLDQTRTQYEVGVVSRVEVVQAEAGVASADFDLIVAKNSYQNAQDVLIAAVLGDRLQATTSLIFDPSDNPEYLEVEPVDLERAVETAFAKRPELAAAQKAIEQGELQLKFAKNQRLPRFDVIGSYTALGVAGEPNKSNPSVNRIPPATAGGAVIKAGPGFGDTFDSYFAGPRDVAIRGVFSIPIPNTTARKNVSKSKIELRRANSEVARLKQGIIVRVRAAARGLLAAAQGVEAAERRRLAAAEQLRAERIRLEHGESTPFDVLQRERDLVEAESQKIAALQAFRNSQAELDRQQGTILENRNIVIAQVRALH